MVLGGVAISHEQGTPVWVLGRGAQEREGLEASLYSTLSPTPGPSNPIPGSFVEPLARSWSHFVDICCQTLTKSLENRLLKFPREGPCVAESHNRSSVTEWKTSERDLIRKEN